MPASDAPQRRTAPPPEIRSLPGAVTDFASTILFDAGFAQTDINKDDLMEALRALEDSREEGRALYPEIILTSKLDDCLQLLYPKQMILCGETAEREGRIKRALKRCAPLAVDPWIIVLEVARTRLRYGLVSSTIAAETLGLPDLLFDALSDNIAIPLVHLRRHGRRAVFIRTPQQQTVLSLTLSEDLLESRTHIEHFADVIVENVVEPCRTGSARMVRTLLTQASQEGHGLLACVVRRADLDAVRSAFPDGAYLEPALSLCLEISHDEQNGREALEIDSALRARVLLGRHMVESDLMTIFTTDGEIVGYNVHIPNSSGAPVTGGGARTRAFSALRMQPFVRAVLICSQDGQTRYFLPDAH